MFMTGIGTIGNDPEIKYTKKGEPVLELNLAFHYGRKGEDGKRPTQWVKASMWGKRAENLSSYLKKGGKIWVAMTDPNVQTYTTKAGSEGFSLVATITDLEFFSQPKEPPAQIKAQPADSFDDDIAF